MDVVYDSVGKDTIERSIRCLRRRGTIVNYGGASGLVASVSPLALAEAGSVFFTRPHLAHYLADRDEIASRTNDLFSAVREGALRVTIHGRYPLERTRLTPWPAWKNRESRGKLLLDI